MWNKMDTNRGSINSILTAVEGEFKCSNWRCSQRWTCDSIEILIRIYRNNRYNVVVTNQDCWRCNASGILTLDEESYATDVACHLDTYLG